MTLRHWLQPVFQCSTFCVPCIELNCYTMRISVDFYVDNNNLDECTIVPYSLELNLTQMVTLNHDRTRFHYKMINCCLATSNVQSIANTRTMITTILHTFCKFITTLNTQHRSTQNPIRHMTHHYYYLLFSLWNSSLSHWLFIIIIVDNKSIPRRTV